MIIIIKDNHRTPWYNRRIVCFVQQDAKNDSNTFIYKEKLSVCQKNKYNYE